MINLEPLFKYNLTLSIYKIIKKSNRTFTYPELMTALCNMYDINENDLEPYQLENLYNRVKNHVKDLAGNGHITIEVRKKEIKTDYHIIKKNEIC